MIKELTEQQLSQLSVFAKKWIDIGLSTSDGFTEKDKNKISTEIDEVYRIAGLDSPRIKIWLSSPMAGAIGASMLKWFGQVGGQVWDQVWGQIRDQARDQVWDQVGTQVRAQVRVQVRDQVLDQVWDQVGAQVFGQVGDQVRDQVRDQVLDQVRAQVLDQVRDQVRAQVRVQVRDQVLDPVWDQVGAQARDQVLDQVWDQVGDQVWDQVGAQVRAQVRAQVLDQVRAQVRAQVEAQVVAQVVDPVRAQVRDQVFGQVLDQVLDQVGDQVRAQVRAQVVGQFWGKVHGCGYGIHDSYWLSFYDFFCSVVDIPLVDIAPIIALSQHIGWWWPFNGAVIITPKPSFLCRDEQGRLHHENRMAIEYLDGFGIYAWHGVRVEPWIILHPERITVQSILEESNQEVKRVMLERYGWDRFLVELGAEEIHRDETGVLVSTNALGGYLDGEDDEARFVFVVDTSTDRRYALRVPPSTQTAKQGVAWTFGREETDYMPIEEA